MDAEARTALERGPGLGLHVFPSSSSLLVLILDRKSSLLYRSFAECPSKVFPSSLSVATMGLTALHLRAETKPLEHRSACTDFENYSSILQALT